MEDLVPRSASTQLEELASQFRVVILNGPRQAGKTTLLRLFQREHGGEYRSLDVARTRAVSRADPETFTRVGDRPIIIDEVQLGGDDLIRAVKQVVDESRVPGQFVLSGSTRFLTIPTLAESLAGRAVFIDLWPLSMIERTFAPMDGAFLERLFAEPQALIAGPSAWTRDDYLEVITRGSYPEALPLTTARARRAWYGGYLRTITSRDIREFAHVRREQLLGRLLELVAARAGSTLALDDLARSLGSTPHTIADYLSYLETVFLVSQAPTWATNLTPRATKARKAYPTDSGLAAHLLRITSDALRPPGHPALGNLVETFVFGELLKLQSLTGDAFGISHYRDRDGREVDFVCEGPDGRVIAIEVKASTSPSGDAARHLRWLRDRLGDRFAAGVVLYLGPDSYSWGDDIYLLPVSALWGHVRPGHHADQRAAHLRVGDRRDPGHAQ